MRRLALILLLAGCNKPVAPVVPIAQKVPDLAPIPAKPPVHQPVHAPAHLPGEAARLLPALGDQIATFWPALEPRAFPAGLIEQESGWKVHAKLHTSRELGVGLGQFTKAYKSDGSVRFDALTEAKALDPSLAGWSWKDPYNEQYQLRAVVLKLKSTDRSCALAMVAGLDALACDAAKYNGGAGSVSKRIRMCRVIEGCDPKRWAGNLDRQCAQSNVKVAGYGESFCTTNSSYPGRVFARMKKYEGSI